VGEALGDADGVLGAVTVGCKVFWAPVPSGVVSVPVRSVCAGGSGELVGAGIRSSRSMESSTERVMPATADPRKITGAMTTVNGKRTHGESPARVSPRRR
jgi:hypothetical protein